MNTADQVAAATMEQGEAHAMGVTLADAPMRRDEVFQRLQQEGYRLTQARRAIVDVVLASSHVFTADGLYAAMRDATGVGRATVFRALETLTRLGYLRRLQSVQPWQYVRAWPGHYHYLICTICQRLVEFDGCTIGTLERELAVNTLFHIQGHALEIFGVCPSCQEHVPY